MKQGLFFCLKVRDPVQKGTLLQLFIQIWKFVKKYCRIPRNVKILDKVVSVSEIIENCLVIRLGDLCEIKQIRLIHTLLQISDAQQEEPSGALIEEAKNMILQVFVSSMTWVNFLEGLQGFRCSVYGNWFPSWRLNTHPLLRAFETQMLSKWSR